MFPLIQSLPPHVDLVFAMERLSGLPNLVALDSALRMGRLGRYSFLSADPFDLIRLDSPQADPLARLAMLLKQFEVTDSVPELPPFQGGAMGFLGYEFGHCFERVPSPKHDEFNIPIAMFGFYDVVLAWDHEKPGTGWIISHGFPEREVTLRKAHAEKRMSFFLRKLSENPKPIAPVQTGYQATAHGLTAHQYQTRLGGGWVGNFDSNGFRTAVEKAREYIYSGDIFQVNLAQRLMKPADTSSLELYFKLREVNAAPFAGYFDGTNFQIASASPERFLQVKDRIVESRPIKGTRRRTGNDELDTQGELQLLKSLKDRSENTMIVDLLRNDLSRICEPNSLSVPQWCEIERYPFVTHLVSSIRARLKDTATVTDLIRATFPGGSITGCPKVRAMEIISELEPTARGPYCGSLGYIGYDGTVDFNILIRTITASRGWWQFQVGGGIVADSRSDAEEEETWIKAAGLVSAINSIS